MSERVDLTVAETKPNNTQYHLERIIIDVDGGFISVSLRGLNGEAISKQYDASTNPTGASLLASLNISNNSAGTSLIKRVYNRLLADGVITGTVSGTPS